MLPGIVEEAGIAEVRTLDHVLDRLAIELGAFHQVVAVIDIGEVMLVVMEFQRLARHVGGERVVSVRKFGSENGIDFLLDGGSGGAPTGP